MRIRLFVFFSIIALCANAQETVKFNYNYPYQWQYDCNSMVIIDSTYYLSGNIARVLETCEYGIYGFHVTRINENGVRDTTIIFDTCNQITYVGWQGSMFNKADTIVVIGIIYNEFYQSKVHVLQLTDNLDTISYNYYYTDTLAKKAFSGCNAKNGSIVFCGSNDSTHNESASPSNTMTKPYLHKINCIGETQWFHTYNVTGCIDDCWSSFRKVINAYDNSFLAIGITHDFNVYKNIIVKVDSLGNQKWVRYYGNPNYDNPYLLDIIETHDSCYIVCGAYTYGETGGGLYPYDGWLIKLDKDGNEKWNKKYRDYVINNTDWRDTITCTFVSIDELYDKGFACIALVKSSECLGQEFRIYRLDSVGNLLWTKLFTEFPECNNTYHPNTIKQTVDSGFAISGWVEYYEWNSSTTQWDYSQRIFLIKTDSLGNDVETTIRPVAAQPISKFELVCYPNPASGEFWVEAPGEDVLEVFATNGSTVLAVNMAQGLNRVDLCWVRPGMYLARLREAGVFGKIIIE